ARLVLERFGLQVDVAADAEASAERLAETDYDLVMIDRLLGDVDGLALGTALAVRLDAAVVIVSGLEPPTDLPMAIGGWLLKPY
ncbi:hypothetical protein J8J27_32145, partial [Mycobacterium tuberculosis]|nr:hypothetical protein [Mycobacterium tuberculosis]